MIKCAVCELWILKARLKEHEKRHQETENAWYYFHKEKPSWFLRAQKRTAP